MSFSEWLIRELDRQGMSRVEAAKRGNISASMFDKIINGHSKPGLDTLQGIARAFDLPLEEVFEKAGILKTVNKQKIAERVAAYKLDELSENQLDEVIQFIEFIQDRDAKRSTNYPVKRKRQGAAPAETLK